MSKIIKTDEGRVIGHKRRTAVVVVVVIVFIAAVVLVILKIAAPKPAETATQASLSTDDQSQLEGDDSRSASVKVASLTARNQASNGDTDGAVRTLTSALAKADSPGKVSLYRQLSSLYVKAGQRADAADAINKALTLTPNDWTLYKSLGLIDSAFGDSAQAKVDYTKADDMLKKTDDYATYHTELQSLINDPESA